MDRVTIKGPDGKERTLELDPAQLRAMQTLRALRGNGSVSEGARILNEALDRLDRANPDRAVERAKRKLAGSY
jgi:hypothetical protein